MALPPEPLQELLPLATQIVDAEVVRVVSEGEAPEGPSAPEGATSVPYKLQSQVVVLKVNRAIRGTAKGEITVEKPQGAYLLSAGNKGGFLLQDGAPHPVIIGRYGPDTYRIETLERAVKEWK